MNDATVLSRLRRFLLTTSALLFVGTVVELWLVGHTESAVQWIPFVLCGVGAVVTVVALLRPRRATFIVLRVCLGIALVGSLFGVYEHVLGNIAFQQEIHPTATTREAVLGAVGGGNPLLAPGILGLAAMLGLAGAYHHPALVNERQEPKS